MLDFQQIVDDLRASLYTNSIEGVDFIRAAAADFSVACDEVNERLRKCGDLLRRGLRSEAIQLAELEPNLLEVVAILDFPDRPQWEQVVERYGIVIPQPLMLEVAAELNEAYAIENPLASLLRQHRLLALSHGPLGMRTRVLRALAERDPGNPIWREDVAAFEHERWKQIRHETDTAAGANDLATLSQLLIEVTDPKWQETPPAALLSQVRDAHERVQQQQAYAELRRLEMHLNAAFGAFEVDVGRRLRAEWQKNVEICRPAAQDPVVVRADPALQWLADQDRIDAQQKAHEGAVRALDQALDKNKPRDTLERLYHAALRNDFAMPTLLETRYQNRIRALQLAATRRVRLIIAAIVAACLLVGAGVGTIIYRQIRAGQIAASTGTLQQLIKEKKLEEAHAYIQRLEKEAPAIAGAQQIAELAVRVQGLRKTEDDRKSRFKDLLALTHPAGSQQPNMEALKQAKELARSDEEELAITKIEADIEQDRLDQQQAQNQAFEKELRTFADRLDQLAKTRLTDLAGQISELQKYRSELQALRDRSAGVSESLLKQIEPLRVRADSAMEQHRKEESQQAMEATIAEKMSDLAAFRAVLTEYAGRFPGTSRSRDFLRVVEEDGLWTGLKSWNDLAAECRAAPLAGIDAKRGGDLLQQITQAAKDHGGYSCARPFRQLTPYLEAVGRRKGGAGEALVDPLKRLFENRFVREVWMLEQDGLRYYMKAPLTLEGEGMRGFRYLVGFDLTEKNASVRRDRVTYVGDAPQVEIAKRVQGLLSALRDENWEANFLDMLTAIADKPKEPDKPDVDPLLKLQLLREIARVGREGSRCLAQGLRIEGTVLDVSQDDPLASSNWLDPNDAAALRRRQAVRSALMGLPDFANVRQAVNAELDKLRKLTFPQYQGIGWLRRDPDDAWRCVSRPNVRIMEDGKLFVLRKAADGGVVLETIGAFRAGLAEISDNASDALVEGRPVFYSSQ